ncbi:MAG: 1-acyl-sn-glycerol-3-phosphate acyltransferase [Clostridia bacterium]|nr:1-acyl-sn-glycerol-3-phosphate acyltransferase [Clostridia bacterium]
MAKVKKQKWTKFRHKVVRNIIYFPILFYTRLAYGIKVKKFKEQGKRPYLILLNHQTPFDQFFCGLAFKGPVYYMATEDIFSMGWISKLIKYLLAPIPIKKQTTDVKAVLNCLRVAKEGGTIAIAPEGNRTYSGKTEYINPSIAPLIKKLKLPVAIFKIEGGYGVEPRWSDVKRKGKMTASVTRVIEPENYLELSDSELYKIVCDELFVNESETGGFFYHKKRAEYLERLFYVCPQCNSFSNFYSENAKVECKKCGKKVEYLPDKRLRGVGFEFPFTTVNEWYEYQKSFVNKINPLNYQNEPIFTDEITLREVIPYKKKVVVFKRAKVSLYGDKIVVEGSVASLNFEFDNVLAISVLGRNKANVYIGDKLYQLKGGKRFNAIKFANLYYRYKNYKKGDENEQFLGL